MITVINNYCRNITTGNHVKVQHIETLVAIADSGSLRGASEKLKKSQPALTKMLKQAEADLGIALFHRSSRGVTLTKIGERVLSRARTITSEMDRLNQEVAQLGGDMVGTINVCLSPFAAVEIMPRALTLFQNSHPDVNVAMSSGLFPNALQPLREGKTDLVIGPAPPMEMANELNVEPLIVTPVVVITSSQSTYANAKSLKDLRNAQWIRIGAPERPASFRHAFIENALDPPKATITSESYLGALALIENLGAVCTFPQLLLQATQKGWDIQKIAIREKIAPIQIAMITRKGHQLTPAADALANCVRRRSTMLRKEHNQ